ncbi:pyridoxine biosynthesis protein PDX2 [Plasmodium gaboni]|uniref:glutaminase n=1 Tax=Plasmodium gaboni TaxID=647221 RepID=A0A151LIJ2_9APIC|nr:pyridoxine biosynthesis protein PDX2 [Plasmodium gaboni]KYN98800.1 pyridoxine biosynthesis protein PDX2 [Plasmodium gaboni]
MSEITIGVLSLQGDFEPHINHFIKLQIPSLNIIQVRNVNDLGLCDGLVIPGGESTTVRRCCAYENDTLYNALLHFIHVLKKPIWGTCAGCILLSKNVENIKLYSNFGNKFSFGGLDITICRNFYGSQVKVIATFSHELYGSNIIAAVEQNNCLGTVFHPELLPHTAFQQYFYEKVKNYKYS